MAGPNLRGGWTAQTLAPRAGLNDASLGSRAPRSSTSATPLATQSAYAPLQNSALFNLGQNQSMSFFQSLLESLGGLGGGGGQSFIPPMASAQSQAIDFAHQRIAAENYQRSREANIRSFLDPRSSSGFEGVSPMSAPMGGGMLPVQNPVMNQFLSNQRLAPAVQLGTAAAAYGSGGFASPMGGRSGWTSSGF